MWEGLAGINLVMGRNCWGFLVLEVLERGVPCRGAGLGAGDALW